MRPDACSLIKHLLIIVHVELGHSENQAQWKKCSSGDDSKILPRGRC
jgi:hypothetical protein